MATRKSNWPTALALFVEEKRAQPFVWGENDCCLFACDWIAMLTGIDPAAVYQLRGAYQSAFGAGHILEKHGGTIEIARTWCRETYGEKSEITPAYAQRGGIVAVPGPHGPALAVCLGAKCATPGETGLVFAQTASATHAWRI